MITNLIFPSFLYSCLTTADADSYASLPIIFPGLNAALYMINNNLNNQQIPGSRAVTRKFWIFKTKSECTSIKLVSSKLSTSNNWWQFTTGPLVDQSPSGRVDQSPSGRVDQSPSSRVDQSPSGSHPPMGIGASFWWPDVLSDTNQLWTKEDMLESENPSSSSEFPVLYYINHQWLMKYLSTDN